MSNIDVRPRTEVAAAAADVTVGMIPDTDERSRPGTATDMIAGAALKIDKR